MIQGRKSIADDGAIPIDEKVLAELMASIGIEDRAAQIEIFDLFFDTAPPLMDRVKLGAEASAWEQVLADLHAFKGSCELFGADHLAQLCKGLERSITAGEIPGDMTAVIEIQAEFDRVMDFLRTKRATISKSLESERSEGHPFTAPEAGTTEEK